MFKNKKILSFKIILLMSTLISIIVDISGIVYNLEGFIFTFIATFSILYGLNILGILKIIYESLLIVLKSVNFILEKLKNKLFSCCSKKSNNKILEEKSLEGGDQKMPAVKKKSIIKKTKSVMPKKSETKIKVKAKNIETPEVKKPIVKTKKTSIKKAATKKSSMKTKPIKLTARKITSKKSVTKSVAKKAKS